MVNIKASLRLHSGLNGASSSSCARLLAAVSCAPAELCSVTGGENLNH